MSTGVKSASVKSSGLHLASSFEGCTHQELEELDAVAKIVAYEKGAHIFRENERSDCLFFVHEGVIKLFKVSSAGKEQALRFLFPGDFFGHCAMLHDQSHHATAEAIDDCRVSRIPGDHMKQLLAKNPGIAYRFLLALSERLHQADEWVGALSLLEVEQRLAKILLFFHQRNNRNNDVVDMAVPKKDLAAMIGASPGTLSRKLAYLETRNLVALSSREIRIPDPSRLKAFAGGSIS